MENLKIEAIVKAVVQKLKDQEVPKIRVEASGRHVHLSKADAMTLFGSTELTIDRELSQPGQYLYKEKVMLIGSKGVIKAVAILGPCRDKTQVELSMTDARSIGLKGVVRDSGDLDQTESVIIAHAGKCITAVSGTIVAKRHIHMTPDDAMLLKVKDKQEVSVYVSGMRPVIFDKVLVRVKADYRLSMHIDYDEANAVGLDKNAVGRIVEVSL
ncbi:phosphate propanoyltransferase [Fusibacter sp. 3D3]|uniref:phosphate propanoyltransferase n=1 Tax=Fusibacter sp. 3D3 TaxID=1048380 RepID=UPI00085319D5|nr:phosphate propanoyltransferase [Fusibacter sp. 3D3]GAU75887.1 ethanolamine utilization protein similar to PduL [Fusibacter sp. 3D3]